MLNDSLSTSLPVRELLLIVFKGEVPRRSFSQTNTGFQLHRLRWSWLPPLRLYLATCNSLSIIASVCARYGWVPARGKITVQLINSVFLIVFSHHGHYLVNLAYLIHQPFFFLFQSLELLDLLGCALELVRRGDSFILSILPESRGKTINF